MNTTVRVRLNMSDLPANYKGIGDGACPLCQHKKGTTEHYFECEHVQLLAKIWDVKGEDVYSQESKKMQDVGNYLGRLKCC